MQTYGTNEPILSSEINFEDYSRSWISKQLAQLCEDGKLIRYEKAFIIFLQILCLEKVYQTHVYSLYKLLNFVMLNDSLRELATAVYEERKPHLNCRSAKDDTDMNALLWRSLTELSIGKIMKKSREKSFLKMWTIKLQLLRCKRLLMQIFLDKYQIIL